jgi:hypothetical protein
MLVDPFDPRTWEKDDHEYRIYADNYANDYAVVDQIDYQYLVQWRWKLKKSKSRPGKKPKIYLARTLTERTKSDYVEGQVNRIDKTLFLHTVVMERTGISKPKTKQTIIVDHANGDGFDCRRQNLRWATISFNNMNRFGSHELQLPLL